MSTVDLERSPPPRRAPRIWAASVVLAAAATLGCNAHSETARRINGQVVSGRNIESTAYALFTQAAYLEQSGHLEEARILYERALEIDPDGPALWTRLGKLKCGTQGEAAITAFTQAETISPQYAPAHIYHSRCLERHSKLDQALWHAELAVSLAPASREATNQWAHLLLLTGRHAAAKRVLLSFDLLFPERRRSNITSGTANAGQRIAVQSEWFSSDSNIAEREIDTQEPVHSSALKAMLRGELTKARQLVKPLVAASPQDADRFVLALCIAYRQQDASWFAELLLNTKVTTIPGPVLAAHYGHILGAIVGNSASHAWEKGHRERIVSERSNVKQPVQTSHLPEGSPTSSE